MEVVHLYKMYVPVYQTTWHHILEDTVTV